MPLTKTDSGNRIRGVGQPTPRQRSDCHEVIAQLDFADLGRGAGTLHEFGQVRLDLQGRTGAGDVNLQVQIGRATVAAALIAHTVLGAGDEANRRGAASAAISVLNQSLDSGTIWHLAGSLP